MQCPEKSRYIIFVESILHNFKNTPISPLTLGNPSLLMAGISGKSLIDSTTESQKEHPKFFLDCHYAWKERPQGLESKSAKAERGSYLQACVTWDYSTRSTKTYWPPAMGPGRMWGRGTLMVSTKESYPSKSSWLNKETNEEKEKNYHSLPTRRSPPSRAHFPQSFKISFQNEHPLKSLAWLEYFHGASVPSGYKLTEFWKASGIPAAHLSRGSFSSWRPLRSIGVCN